MIIAFCGHSEILDRCAVKERLLRVLCEVASDGDCELYLGGYGDFDILGRECRAEYKRTHPEARLYFITPYLAEEYQRSRVDAVSGGYDGVIYPPIERVPYRYAIVHRNRWMVDAADLVIAYIDHGFGGAYKSFCYAKRRGKRIINLGKFEV